MISTMSPKLKKLAASAGVLLFWLAVWTLAAFKVKQELLIPYPWVVARHLYDIVRSGTFLKVVFTSLLRVLGGFACGCVAGTALAVLCSLSKVMDRLFRPFVRIVSSIPVTSFIILVMLWLPYTYVPVFIAALLVTPILFGNVRTGISETDGGLLEVARVFRFSGWKTLTKVYVPSVLPYFYSGALTALGLAWKAGIAAETLALPKNAIGSGMYYSKIYLETADLFAWTAVVVLFSFCFERLLHLSLVKKKDGEEGE